MHVCGKDYCLFFVDNDFAGKIVLNHHFQIPIQLDKLCVCALNKNLTCFLHTSSISNVLHKIFLYLCIYKELFTLDIY